MDGENNGKPYFQMDDLGVFPYFWKHQNGIIHVVRPSQLVRLQGLDGSGRTAAPEVQERVVAEEMVNCRNPMLWLKRKGGTKMSI